MNQKDLSRTSQLPLKYRIHLMYLACIFGFFTNTAQADVEWRDLQGKFKCNLTSKLKETKLIPFKTFNPKPRQMVKVIRSPIFKPPLELKVELTYMGQKAVKVKWDKRFDRVLWNGRNFLITIQQGNTIVGSSRTLITSNTVPFSSSNPRPTLKFGGKLYSTLNFNKLYATYMTGGIKTGKTKFQLYLVKKTSHSLKKFSRSGSQINKNGLVPICNSVTVQIK